jgi:hypothetical protein
MRTVRDYVERYVAFSFNHYMSPQQQWGNYHRTYLQYLSIGAVDRTPPSTPSRLVARAKNYNSDRLDWAPSTDDMAVAGDVLVGTRMVNVSSFYYQPSLSLLLQLGENGVPHLPPRRR